MKLLHIVPITGNIWSPESQAYVTQHLLPDTEVVTQQIEHGPGSIEGEYDEMLAVPETVFRCKEAQDAGFDGVFIDCYGEPGVRAARELLDIPVFGGFEPAISYALTMADKVGIVTVLPNVVPLIGKLVSAEGLEHRVVCVRTVNIPVLDLADIDKLSAALVEESARAINDDHAEMISLGCTAMIGVAERVEKELTERFKMRIPVIEAAQASLIMLETFVRMNYSHSKITYMNPTKKSHTWWGDGKVSF